MACGVETGQSAVSVDGTLIWSLSSESWLVLGAALLWRVPSAAEGADPCQGEIEAFRHWTAELVAGFIAEEERRTACNEVMASGFCH